MQNRRRFLYPIIAVTALVLLACATFTPKPTPTATVAPQPTAALTPTVEPSPTSVPQLADIAGLTCQGQPIPEAADFNDSPDAVHAVFLTDMSGREHPWNQSLPEVIQAKSVDTLEAVICLGDQVVDPQPPEDCGQYTTDQGLPLFLQESRFVMDSRLVAAKTGATITEKQVLGALPGCPKQISGSDPKLVGSVLYGADITPQDMLSSMLPLIIPASAPRAVGSSDGGIMAVAISPDGSRVASAPVSSDDSLEIWDVKNASKLLTLQGHTSQVEIMTFSPDGSLLASAGDKGEIIVWDTTSGQIRQKLNGHKERVLALVFSPDSKQLASAGFDAIINLWDVQSGKRLHELKGHTIVIGDLVFSPDGSTLASLGGFTLKIHDTSSGAEITSAAVDRAYSLVLSPDNKSFIVFSFDLHGYNFTSFDVVSGKRGESTDALELSYEVGNMVPSLYIPRPNWLVTCDIACYWIVVTDLNQNSELYRFNAKLSGSSGLTDLALSPDGRYLAGGYDHGELYVWDLGWLSEFK